MSNDVLFLVSDVSILSNEAAYEKAYAVCPQFRRQKADRYRFCNDKWLCIGVWNLLMYAFKQYEIKFDPDLYSISEYGKPVYPGIEFSFSHSGIYAACSVSVDLKIGCDIEKVSVHKASVAERVFCPAELNYIAGSDERFTKIWTLRESVMKCTGLGFRLKQDLFSVAPGDCSPIVNHFDSLPYRTSEVETPNGYCAALCAQTEIKYRHTLQIHPLENIIDMM